MHKKILFLDINFGIFKWSISCTSWYY